MSSWNGTIYFVVKRPYDFILTLILRKVNKNKRYVIFEERGDFLFATISILETVGFILSISVVEELRPRWLSLPLS